MLRRALPPLRLNNGQGLIFDKTASIGHQRTLRQREPCYVHVMNDFSPVAVQTLSAPPFYMLAREGISFAYMRAAASYGSTINVDACGNGEHIIIIPGFMASDRTTDRLRRSLNAAGFAAYGWGLGRNRKITADLFSKLDARLNTLHIETPVTLIGWSLGGLIAREFAKHFPHRVAKVITLGSPFSGGQKANNAWRFYEMIAGHKVDNPPIEARLHEKPDVPTIAFWSPRDGVVAPRSARGLPEESDRQVELSCTHMAFVAQPKAIAAIAAAAAD
jgi:pimeloyl-ACP methyl ester carboxylesterase